MEADSERVNAVLRGALRDAFHEWRRRQPALPDKAKTARELIRRGLRAEGIEVPAEQEDGATTPTDA